MEQRFREQEWEEEQRELREEQHELREEQRKSRVTERQSYEYRKAVDKIAHLKLEARRKAEAEYLAEQQAQEQITIRIPISEGNTLAGKKKRVPYFILGNACTH